MTAIAATSSINKKTKKQKKTQTGSTFTKKRNKSVRLQLKNGRIYGSENGKSCHQCRQKTLDFSLSCKFLNGNTECTLHFCYKCLLNRYGEIAEEIAGTGCQWKCPRCRGICNCCLCMKKRGLQPTGILIPIAKSRGFSSVSEMLQLEKFDSPREDAIVFEKNWKMHSHEDTSVEDIKIGRRENDLKEETDSKSRLKNKVIEFRKRKKLVTKKEDDNDNNVIKKGKSKAAPKTKGTFNGLANEPVEEVILDQENEVKMQTNVSDTEILLPQGTELTKVANFDLLADDVGHALQFLEFCDAFAQVLDLEKGEPELLLKEIYVDQDSDRSHRYSIKTLCIKLLSIIRNDAEEGCSSEESLETNPLLEALTETKCLQLPDELTGEDSDLKTNGYNIELNSSRKLKILNFLCDEALGTQELRNWIEAKTLESYEQQKLQDKMTKAIVLKNGAPLSVSEHANLVSLIKAEVSKSLAEKPGAENGVIKKSDAVRSDPIVMDAFGRKFWKLKGYNSEMDILRQDVSHGDIDFYKEKWFSYHISEKASMEAYISSFKKV